MLRSPVRLAGAGDDASAGSPAPAPACGEHTDLVLTKAGFTLSEIATLRREKAV